MKIDGLRYPLIIAHRGYSARYPENTLIAFEKALESGVQMIELDVTLTRDRKIVVIHDETLYRTTSGRGKVADYTLTELKMLDAGGWFSDRFSGEAIPVLTEVLTLAGGRATVNIEIKPEAYDPRHPKDAIERQIWRMLHHRHLLTDVLVSSFEAEILAELARMTPKPNLAFLTKGRTDTGVFDTCRKIDAFSWNAHYRDLNRTRVESAHDLGLKVFAYTVNAPDDILALIDMGVDGIYTDDPTAVDMDLRCGRRVS